MSGTWIVTLAALLVRLALWPLQPGLTYDGTYYLRQAERLLHLDYQAAGFPPGYPLAVALLRLVTGDFELAGRVVNLVAGTATVALFHLWARRHLPRSLALAAALFLAVHPEMARHSVQVLSEPLYVLCIVLGFELFERRRDLAAGALYGYAFLVRPEAVALLGGLALARLWEGRRSGPAAGATPTKAPIQPGGVRRLPLQLLGAGLLPVILYVAMSSHALGHWTLTPKQSGLDLDVDIGGRLWTMVTSLHTLFPLILLPGALLQGWLKQRTLLAGLFYLTTLPFFSVHIQPRLMVPALPFLLVLSLVWIAGLRVRWRRPVFVAAAGFAIWGATVSFRDLFSTNIVTPYDRMLGSQLRPYLRFDDRVACRFPFVPYYAGAGFTVVPRASYLATMESLVSTGTTHLLVLEHEVINMVPQLRPLFDDASFVTAEGRLELVTALAPEVGPRALLYRFRPPAIQAPARVDSNVVAAAWAGRALVFTTRDGRVHVGVDSTARGAGSAFAGPEVWHGIAGASDVCASADGERIAFVQEENGVRQLTEFERPRGTLRRHPATAGEAPSSPCYVGDLLVYVRQSGAGGLRVLEPGRRRVRSVYLSGLQPGVAEPRAVTARGVDLAITYSQPGLEHDDYRIVATARWPAVAASDTAVVVEGRWATALALADDSLAWVPGADQLLASIAVREFDADGRAVGSFSILALIGAAGRARALSFEIPAPRRPAVGDGRLAFLAGRADLCTASLHAEDLRFPEIKVFDAPRESLRRQQR